MIERAKWIGIGSAAIVLAFLVGNREVDAQGKGGSTTSGVASLRGTDSGDLITADIAVGYAGAFDRQGNFSFNLYGTSRRVCLNFSQARPLFEPPRIPNATPPASGCYAVAFTTLSDSTGAGLAGIAVGTTELRAVRFNWNNPSVQGPNDPTTYHLGFRGDANTDGVVDMSLVRAHCDAGDAANRCRQWTLQPCPQDDLFASCDSTAVPPEGAPIGRVGGGFPKGQGSTDIARYVLPWTMTIVRN